MYGRLRCIVSVPKEEVGKQYPVLASPTLSARDSNSSVSATSCNILYVFVPATMASPLISRPLLFRPRHQVRHATLLRRPKKPYTFTQMITLSDGSTFLHRTTSPQPIYRTTRDTKNNVLWNPSSQKLLNIEEDEAGRLKRFRKRFGRGFDAEGAAADATSEGVVMGPAMLECH